MKRRTFIKSSSLAAAVTAVAVTANADSSITGTAGTSGKNILTAAAVNSYLRSLCEVKEPSVDRVIIGDPETRVTRIGTAWMPYWKTLRQAVKRGVNTMVVHEPTFYSHWDLEAKEAEYTQKTEEGKTAYLKAIDQKKRWINEQGLVIIRCHDVLDIVPEFGVPYAFGQALGFTNNDIIRSKKYFNVYQMDSTPAITVAKRIAEKLKSADQAGVAFYGDPNYPVSALGLGTGCACDPLDFMDMNADLYVAIDDTIRTWTQSTFAEDTGKPLIVINHGTSEEFGMRSLRDQLNQAFPAYPVEHFSQGCGYRWVSA